MGKFAREPQKPLPWNAFVASRRAWFRPFLAIDWGTQWLAYILGRWALLEVLEYVGSFSILVAVIFYFAGAHDRLESRHYQAWQVINSAQGKGGNGGRIDALQDLNEDHVSLGGIDVSDAFLQGLQLAGADLRRADFSGCDLRDSNLSSDDFENAGFRYANLRGAQLNNSSFLDANLANADLVGADLSGVDLQKCTVTNADLRNTNLSNIIHWQSIADISGANIAGVKNAPAGFVAWAIGHGAVQTATTEPSRK